MKPYLRCMVFLFLAWLTMQSANGQTINGPNYIRPGGDSDYSLTGGGCASNTRYSWSVTGGVLSYPNNSTNSAYVTVTWDVCASSRELRVSVDGERYDSWSNTWDPVHCGDYVKNGFTLPPTVLGHINLPDYPVNNMLYSTSGKVCPNIPFILTYEGSSLIQQVNWFQWDGTAWQPMGVGVAADDFAITVSAITTSKSYKAVPMDCNNTALTPESATIDPRDLDAARGVVLGSRDVAFGANAGAVTFSEYESAVQNWQKSEDGGVTWTDLSEFGEELTYTNLTITTQFRVKSLLLPCGDLISEPCTIRVVDDNYSWIEEKKYGDNNQLISNSRSYFNLSGQLLQSQSKNFSRGKILVTQPLTSQYDQIVGSTLAAPISETDFTYKPRFVIPIFTASIPYTYKQFEGSSLNSPVAVGNSSGLGWYYSSRNTLEPSTAITAYPYSRSEESPDGSTGVVRSAGVGETFRMGQGKESVQGSFAVREELNTYVQLRNYYFPASVIGEQITKLNASGVPTLGNAATQQVSINPNGQKAVTFQDKEGHTVMVARPGHANGWENVNNTVEIGWPYCFVKSANQRYETPVFEATADIQVYDVNYTRVFEGHARDFDLSTYTAYCRIYCNEPFRIVVERIVDTSSGNTISWHSTEFLPTRREAYAYYNFYTFEAGSVTISNLITGSDYTVVNTVTGVDVTSSFKSNATIPAGFYQVRILKGAVTLAYSNSYQDISYSFYNQKGQLLGSLAPNGAQLVTTDLAATNLTTYPTTTALPFYTSYEYDVRGRLLALNETDAGRTRYYYRNDGKIRFSQNAKQLPLGYFSYTNYDDAGRPVESGECQPTSTSYFATIAESATVLENTEPRGGFALDQIRRDAVLTTYDLAVTIPNVGSAYTQEFLAGNVSSTRKFGNYIPQVAQTLSFPIAQTWFSYDEQGRTKWVVRQLFSQYPHTLDYDYDANGNVLSVAYNKNAAATRFTHYYSYDADQRLSEVRTNTAAPTDQGVARQLKATYTYYLHGPLKRVVIGGLQGMDYIYTAQGWLKSINGVQTSNDPSNDSYATTGLLPDLFSQELEYFAGDYSSAQRPRGTFTSTSSHPERFDGTLRASAWRTPSRPGLHGYGYQYDERGQLTQADYGRPVTGRNQALEFTSDPLGRYREANLTYDPNGNLKTLQRTDRLGDYAMNIDYRYLANTNKLERVRQPSLPPASLINYTYDALGHLASQQEAGKNKYFDYDVSGKVTNVYRDAAKTSLLARYAYDEFGQRIQQRVYDAQGSTAITEYIRDAAGSEVASYAYNAQTGNMDLAEQPIYGASRIGVVRQPKGTEAGAQLYELNDQLGNTRVVFQAPHTKTYLLTMEDGNTDQEKEDFPTPDPQVYDNVRTKDVAMQASPYGQSFSMDLFAQAGPGKKLAVAPGDEVSLGVFAAYNSGFGPILGRSQAGASPKMGLFLGAGTALAQPRPQESPNSRPLPAWQQLLSKISVGVAIPLSSSPTQGTPQTITGPVGGPNYYPPKDAGLRYVLRLVRDQSIVRTGIAKVTSAAEGQWQQLKLHVVIDTEEPAELEVWVANKDEMHVFFDDLIVEHYQGPIVQENHFYAYGQRNEGLSWTRQYMRGYGRGYQGQNTRFDEETSYDNFELRMYDSRIGRWTSTDPMGQYHSPYLSMGNNPVSRVDANGGSDTDWYRDDSNPNAVPKWFEGSGPQDGYTHLGDHFDGLLDADGGQWRGFADGKAPTYWIGQNVTVDGKEQYWSLWRQGRYDLATAGTNATVFMFEAMLPVGEAFEGARLGVGALRTARWSGTGRVFWQGGRDAMNAANTFAKANGMTTLNMTIPGKFVSTITKPLPWKLQKPIWGAISRIYAIGAEGSVTFVQKGVTSSIESGSIWRTVEYPILSTKNSINWITL